MPEVNTLKTVSYTHLIEYDCLKQRYPLYLDDLNEIVELLVETVCACLLYTSSED